MNDFSSLLRLNGVGQIALAGFALLLLVILIISFRSRAVVFCQYLKAMTGVQLSPAEVRRVFRAEGKNGVRAMFLDLLIRQDFEEEGPVQIPESQVAPSQEAS